MMIRKLYMGTLIAAAFGVQVAFGWGNATHVYVAKQLGAKFGLSNMNEMYGAVLPDCFNLILTEEGQFLYAQTHDNAMPVWLAADSRAKKSLALGYMSHNQSWGADYTAHIKCFSFPDFISPVNGRGGYAVEKGFELMPQLVPVLKQILLDTGALDEATAEMFAMGLAHELGHDLSETAVDLLVKRNLDRGVGARMALAARCRPACAGELLAAAYANDLALYKSISVEEATAYIVAAEQEYRQYIIQYGVAFSLPEQQTIAMLSEQLCPVAEMFIEAALASNSFPDVDVAVTVDQVTQFINAAIAVVKPDYAREVSRTLCFVEKGLREHGIRTGWQIFAKNSGEEADEITEAATTPEVFSLAQNSPNPFNPTTNIGYSVGVISSQSPVVSSHVRLTVYDLLGREVAVLVDEEKAPGNHTVQFDARGLASGVYLCRLSAGDFVATRRLILMK